MSETVRETVEEKAAGRGGTLPYSEKIRKGVEELTARYGGKNGFVRKVNLGKSFFGEDIPLLLIGKSSGEAEPPRIFYVAGHHAMETVASEVLLRFAAELCAAMEKGTAVYRIQCDYLLRHRCIAILPLLNPDGANLAKGCVPSSHPLFDRLRKMNGGRSEFSTWQANGRGVDLNHNYNAGFAAYKPLETQMGIYGGAPTRYSGEYPESEPETAALAAWIRRVRPSLTLTLHTQGEEIYCGRKEKRLPETARIAAVAARMTGYRLGVPEGPAAYGGLADWMSEELRLPCLTLECGKGRNPLPQSDLPYIYEKLRRFLFTAPTLVSPRNGSAPMSKPN